jgi:integrase
VAKLTFSDVDSLLDAKREAGLSASTRRLIRSVLVQATNQAMKWRIVTRNEVAMSTPVTVHRSEGSSLSPAQAKCLMETLKTSPMGTLFTVMLTTGMRRGEAIGLRWEDVDLKKGVISVRQQVQRINGELKATEVKTERSRRSINLAKPTVMALKEHEAAQMRTQVASPAWTETGYVFTTGLGTPLDPRTVAKQFEAACMEAKLGSGTRTSSDTAPPRSCWRPAPRSRWCRSYSDMRRSASPATSTDTSSSRNAKRPPMHWPESCTDNAIAQGGVARACSSALQRRELQNRLLQR